MASKRKSKEWLKRSLAAKKGWAKRKKKTAAVKKAKAVNKKLRNAQLGLPKKKRKKVEKLPKTSKKSIAELEEIIRRKEEEIEVLKLTANWVNAMPDEYIKKGGVVALQPSRARWLGSATEYMKRKMKSAAKKGETELRRIASMFAIETNLPLREIYTLHYSP